MAAPLTEVKITGLRELEMNLAELAEEFGPKNAISALRTPMRNSLKIVAEEIRNKTPVDSGALRESVDIRINQPSNRLLRSRHINNQAIIIGRVGWFWRNTSLWRRALAVEFGNRRTRAQPVLNPALDLLASTLVNNFAPQLAKNIETTARRLGRRSAAGTLRRR